MDFILFFAKVALVPVALWLSFIIGFVAGFKYGAPDDIRQTYTASFGVLLAWIVTVPLVFLSVGWQAFTSGLVLSVAIALATPRRR